MSNEKNNKIRIGFFISLGIVLFVVAILVIGREQNMFKRTVRITTVFKNVHGLKVGNNVRFSGIDIGAVVEMNILSDTTVMVELSIDEDVIPFIKKNSLATIGSEGLMGNKFVHLLPGTSEAKSIEKGDNLLSIEPVELDDIIQEIKASAEKISMVSNNLISITNKINRGDGVFGKLFTDESFMNDLENTSHNISIVSRNLIDISEKANKGHGIFGKMFTDTLVSSVLDSATRNLVIISDNLTEITEKINRGEGVFGRLFTDTTITNNLYVSSQNLKATSQELNKFSHELNKRNTLLYKLVSDTIFADSMEITLERINQGVIEATEASKALQNSGLVRMFSKDNNKSNKHKKEDKND